MIKSLRIRNFILVKDLEIEFGEGLNVLTGETGAGKSVIAGAFALLLGQRARSGFFFDEQKPIYLETVFYLARQDSELIKNLQTEGFLDEQENELIITREILPDNTSKSYINGKRVTISVIKGYRDALIDFHSQRDQINLFSPVYQLNIVDIYGELMDKRSQYQKLYEELNSKIERLTNLKAREHQEAERQRLFAYQIEELEELDLKINEEEELKRELDLLTHSEDILNDCMELEQQFYENENSLFDQINTYSQRFQRFIEDSENIRNVVLSLNNVLQILTDVRTEARTISEAIDFDINKLQVLEDRMNEILRIKNKYKMEVPELLDYLSEMRQALDKHASCEKEIEKLQDEITHLSQKLQGKAADLSLDRKKVSRKLSHDIKENIKRLAIPDGDFQVDFASLNRTDTEEDLLQGLGLYGEDRVDFLFSANKGRQLQSLKNAVSGGELSRLLLVIKKILAGRLDTLSLIFDEIDSGIGGKTANQLGEFISEVGRFHQVLCITHLPQIAAYAARHFFIEKKTGSEKSRIEIRELTGRARKEEIARMLAGSKSETAMKHAEEILKKD